MLSFEDWLSQAEAHTQVHGRPLVGLCYAQSLDGCLTDQPGSPLALSGPQSSELTHRLRASFDGILVGIGTLLADDPELTVRLVAGRHPQPIILDSHLRTPLEARLLRSNRQAPRPWIAAEDPPDPTRSSQLRAAGAQLIPLPSNPKGLDLVRLLELLPAMGIHSLMVEGGAQVITSFLSQGLADFAVITLSPCFLGGLPVITPGGLAAGAGQASYPRLHQAGCQAIGEDWMLWGRLK